MPSKVKNASENEFYVSKSIVEKSIFALGSRKVLSENVFMSIAVLQEYLLANKLLNY